ncbi:hypothetical protein NUW58_g6147 [Xylaria curta]|uniref:Uncharacterized protein n=1 Tax=Xylaria curta TaxID=42375 RepID=A0ACC1NYM2_9PEZI|nr:hypothetical protein NUW58_g6147 [Xylaria curta]
MDEDDRMQSATSDAHDSVNRTRQQTLIQYSRYAIWPILFLLLLINLTNGISNIPLNRLLERRLCRAYYESDHDVDETLCKVDSVQQDLAWIMGGFETLWIVGEDFTTTIPLTFLSERYGRKRVLLLNLVPRFFMLLWTLGIAYFEDYLPPRAAIAGASLSVLGGDTVFNSLIYGLAARITEDGTTRAVYFSRMTALTSVVGFLSPAIAAAAMTIKLSLPFWLGLVFLVIAFPIILFLLPVDDGDVLDSTTEARRPLISSPTLKAQASRASLVASVVDRVRSLVSAVGNFQLALLLLSMLLTSLASADTKLLAQYISKRYHWTFASAGYLLSAKAVVNFFLLTFVVPFFLATRGSSQSLSDNANIRYTRFCLVSSVLGAFAIGVSSVIWELIPSLLIYALGVPLSVFTLSLANSPAMWAHASRRGSNASDPQSGILSIVMMVKTLGSLIGAPLMATLWYYGIQLSFYGSPYIASSLIYLAACQQPYGEAAGYYNNAQEPANPYGQQQQQYGAPPPPPQYSEKPMFDQAFKLERPKYNDLWAGILFLLVCAGFVAVSGLAIHGYASQKGTYGNGIYDSNSRVGLNTNTIILFAFILAVAVVLSYSYVLLARTFPRTFIWVTGILNIVFGLVTAIYMLYRHYWSGGIVFLIFTVFWVIAFITWIPRIPFSALMLQTTVDVSKSYGHYSCEANILVGGFQNLHNVQSKMVMTNSKRTSVFLVSFLAGILGAAFAAYFSVTFVAVYTKYSPNGGNPACSVGGGGCSNSKVIGLLVFITFASYWISEVLKNVTHTTISGVFGSWYFFHPSERPRGVTRGALKRSLTYSFGSISLGSLVVAIINLLRQLCSIARQNEMAQGNIIASILFLVLGCFIALLDWAVQFLNRYAFSYIALYGKAYIAAAKDTWNMIKQRGIDALINECLLGPVFSMGATFVGFACALLAHLYLEFTAPAYNSTGAYTPVVDAFAFLIGLQICNVFTTPLSSGADTIFVAAAWEPARMVQNHPELYDAMVRVYPQVQNAIHA